MTPGIRRPRPQLSKRYHEFYPGRSVQQPVSWCLFYKQERISRLVVARGGPRPEVMPDFVEREGHAFADREKESLRAIAQNRPTRRDSIHFWFIARPTVAPRTNSGITTLEVGRRWDVASVITIRDNTRA